jgi:hypothetical protein
MHRHATTIAASGSPTSGVEARADLARTNRDVAKTQSGHRPQAHFPVHWPLVQFDWRSHGDKIGRMIPRHLCLPDHPGTRYGGAQCAASSAGARRIAPRGRLQRGRRNHQARSAKEIWGDHRRRVPASSCQTRLASGAVQSKRCDAAWWHFCDMPGRTTPLRYVALWHAHCQTCAGHDARGYAATSAMRWLPAPSLEPS